MQCERCVVVREESCRGLRRRRGEFGQHPAEVTFRVYVKKLARPDNRVDHRGSPACVRVADEHPVAHPEFCRTYAPLDGIVVNSDAAVRAFA